MKTILFFAFFGPIMPGALGAATAGTATVAIITNKEGAHLSAYFPAVADSPETTSVFLSCPDDSVTKNARATLGAKLKGVYPDPTALFAAQKPVFTLVSLEPRLAPAAIRAALEAGSHVLAEKPACLSAEEFSALAALARQRGLNLMLALSNRLNPEVEFARDLLKKGTIGKVYGLEVHIIADQTRLKKPDYHKSWFAQKARAGGGHLIWLGIHWVDLAMNLTGANVTEVAAFTANVGGQKLDVEDSASLVLKFDQGFLGTMTSGYYLDKGYHSHIKIWGADGWIELNKYGGETPVRYYSSKWAKPEIKGHTPNPNAPTGYPPFVAAAVRSSLGLEAPALTTDDSLRVIQTIYAAYKSAEQGSSVKISEGTRKTKTSGK